jgi:hypothetical protein
VGSRPPASAALTLQIAFTLVAKAVKRTACDQSLLERQIERVELRPFTLERFHRRRQRKERNQRIGAAVVALAVAAAGIGVLARAFSERTVPASDPVLGVFEPVAGRIVYVNDGIDLGYDRGLWAVDPSGPSDTTEGPSVADDVASTLMPLAPEDAIPLDWSSDGTELLFKRTDGDRLFPQEYLYILHADGSETRLNRDPMYFGGATISPDGTRVVFAAWGDDLGLWVVDDEGGRPVRLPLPGAEGIVAAPTFSPDGTQIAYLDRGDPENHVWVMDADGSNAHELLANEPTLVGGVGGLQWSPAGDRLALGVGGYSRGSGRPVIYTFAPDGSDLTRVITGGIAPYWSPDGSQIAYTIPCDEHPRPSCPEGTPLRAEFDPQPGESPAGLAIADADGSNVRAFGFAASGPWHPAPANQPTPSPAPSESVPLVGAWASTDYNDHGTDTASHQTMMIRAGEEGVLHITVHDDSSYACSDTPATMTGTGRLKDPTTLVVPSPVLACLGGRDPIGDGPSQLEEGGSYALVLDSATDRLYDNLGVVWTRGAPPENRTDDSTEAGVDGLGTFAMLYGEVTFRATGPWNDHIEGYLDPRLFFLIGPGDEGAPGGETGDIEILVNALPPETPCDTLRVPPSAEELVQAIRSNPDLEATEPVSVSVGGIDALQMDVVAAPGASIGPCGGDRVPVASVPGRGAWGGVEPGGLGRLYVLDLPGGSARTLAILITAPDAALFEQAVEAAVPVLDSFEFHTG